MKNFIIILAFSAFVQPPDFDSAVLLLSGAQSMEELDENSLQHYRELVLRPLELNGASRNRLLSCGLFSAFQVASFLDWKQRSGDVLSYVELGLIDGFTPEIAEALKLFTLLESRAAPGARRNTRFHSDLTLRAAAREHDGPGWNAGLKYKASLGDVAELNWSTRNTYSDSKLSIGTLSSAYYGRRWLGKLVLGHFNARFGQGLAMWSGMSLSRYGSLSSFMRNGTGFTPTGSFSPEHFGLAADVDLGNWNIAAAYSLTERQPMAAVSYCGRRFTVGAFASDRSCSADFKLGLKNLSLFGELAWTGTPAGVAGLVWTPAYKRSFGITGSVKDGIYEWATGMSAWNCNAVIYLSPKKIKATMKYAPVISAGASELQPALRIAATHTDKWRFEGRGEFGASVGRWSFNVRADLVHSRQLSALAYIEGAWKVETFTVWLRGTAFAVDEWDDRIYVYERDAPGNFNVPAYYGRGWSAALNGAWKASRRSSIYFRLSYLGYPWMTSEKPSKTEVKLQYTLKL